MGWGLSGHHDPELATLHVIEQVRQQIGPGAAQFAFLFVSAGLMDRAATIAARTAEALGTDAIIGCSSPGLIGGRSTLEQRTGVALLAAQIPGISVRRFAIDPREEPTRDDDWDTLVAERMLIDAHRGSIVLIDPATMPTSRPIDRLDAAFKSVPLLGALTSNTHGKPAALVDGPRVRTGGLVGLSIGGDVAIDVVLAQGCRPVGSPVVVTSAKRNLICELSGRPAIEVIREVAHTFDHADRRMLASGLYIGLAIDEYRDRFGRGDFIVRKVVGGHEPSGAVAIDAQVRAGRTVQVHLLDPELARSDLSLLLDGQKLHSRPLGGLLLTDAGRGRELFGDDWSDAIAVARAFDQSESGVDAAKVGHEIAESGGSIPLSGCFTSGQLACSGGACRAHALAACLALFRTPT